MSFVDELERAIAEVKRRRAHTDKHGHRVAQSVITRVLDVHGPRLLAAVRLAESYDALTRALYKHHVECMKGADEYDKVAMFGDAEALNETNNKNLAAYRTACAGDSETGREQG